MSSCPKRDWEREKIYLMKKQKILALQSYWRKFDNLNTVFCNDDSSSSEEWKVTRTAVTKVWTEENSQFCCWVTFECQEKLMENGYLNKSIMPSAKFLKLLWRVIDAVGSNFILPKTWVMKGNKNKKLRITQNSKYDHYSKRLWGTQKLGRYQHKDLGTKTGEGHRGRSQKWPRLGWSKG